MAIQKVNHLNFIGHEINESIQFGYPTSDREIFCKRLHVIKEPTVEDCENCPYFAGFMMGHGHNCYWEDVVPVELEEIPISHEDRQDELFRVSQLIDQGYIQKG